jgi:Predicted ATPase (AAA+ superfamily)
MVPRGVGKTKTALGRAATAYRLDDPAVRAIIGADPQRVTTGARPVLIDEWQAMPEAWDLVRRAVDDDGSPGQYLLTGSAAPTNPPTHSGAARIISLRMRSMTLAERGVAVPSVGLSELLQGRRPAIEGTTDVVAEGYAHEILASGLPGLLGMPERAVRAQLDGYLERIIDRDFEDLGVSLRNPAALRRWMTAYASALSGTTSYEKIRDAATAGNDEKPAKSTVHRYLDTLERLWVVEPIPAWTPARNDLARLALSPKHQLADPALAARLRGATIETLLEGTPAGSLAPRDATLFGALFESQVAHDVRTYAQAAEARVSHFRTRNGDREVDLIVERADHRVVAIEVKLARTVAEEHVRHLLWLRERLGDALLDAVVVTTGAEAYRRRDGIAVIPAALLGP